MIDNAMHRLWGFGFGLVLDKITMKTQKSSYQIKPKTSFKCLSALSSFIEFVYRYSSVSSSDLEVLSYLKRNLGQSIGN